MGIRLAQEETHEILLRGFLVLKGRGFSRAAGADEGIAALAAEGMFGAEQTLPVSLKRAG